MCIRDSTDTPVPVTGPTSTSNELAAMAADNIKQRDGEGVGSKPGGDDAEDEVVPTGYCYPYIIMAGAWGRHKRCPTEWKYLTSSDGPSSRSKNGGTRSCPRTRQSRVRQPWIEPARTVTP